MEKQPTTIFVYVRVLIDLITEETSHSQLTPDTYRCEDTVSYCMHSKLMYQWSSCVTWLWVNWYLTVHTGCYVVYNNQSIVSEWRVVSHLYTLHVSFSVTEEARWQRWNGFSFTHTCVCVTHTLVYTSGILLSIHWQWIGCCRQHSNQCVQSDTSSLTVRLHN